MRRTALTLLTLATLSLVTACGGGGGGITKSDAPPVSIEGSGDETATDDPATDDTTADDPATDDTSGDTSDGGASDGLGGTGFGGGDLDKCLELGEAFTQIAADAGTMDEETARQTIEEMTSLFPADLQDEFATLIETYSSTDPAAYNSEAFTQANEALTDYLTELCTP